MIRSRLPRLGPTRRQRQPNVHGESAGLAIARANDAASALHGTPGDCEAKARAIGTFRHRIRSPVERFEEFFQVAVRHAGAAVRDGNCGLAICLTDADRNGGMFRAVVYRVTGDVFEGAL